MRASISRADMFVMGRLSRMILDTSKCEVDSNGYCTALPALEEEGRPALWEHASRDGCLVSKDSLSRVLFCGGCGDFTIFLFLAAGFWPDAS